jgi:regulatory protein
LHLGQELDEGQVAALKRRDLIEWTYERTLHFISFRPRSEQEVRRYLARREVDEDVIGQVLERLLRANLVNDADFARYWVENRAAFRPRGAWALRAELRAKGVSAEVIESEVADVDEAAGARQAAERVLARYAALDQDTFARRMMGYLQRRGFGYGVCRELVATLWQQVEDRRG